jgi:hypothetical protein
MTVRLPSLSIKQVIQNVILHAEKHLLYVDRNIMLVLYGLVVLFVFTGYDPSSYGREERRIQGFGGENLRERDHLGDPGLDGSIILR